MITTPFVSISSGSPSEGLTNRCAFEIFVPDDHDAKRRLLPSFRELVPYGPGLGELLLLLLSVSSLPVQS